MAGFEEWWADMEHDLPDVDPVEQTDQTAAASAAWDEATRQERARSDEEIKSLRQIVSFYESAITEAEAILGGEYDEHFGPFFDLVERARNAG